MSHVTLYVYLRLYISASMERKFFVILQVWYKEEVVIAWQMSRLGKAIQFVQGACNAMIVTFTSPWNGAQVCANAMPTSPYWIDHHKTRVNKTKFTFIRIAAFSIIITFLWSPVLRIVPKMNATVIHAYCGHRAVMNGWGFSFLRVSRSCTYLMQSKRSNIHIYVCIAWQNHRLSISTL